MSGYLKKGFPLIFLLMAWMSFVFASEGYETKLVNIPYGGGAKIVYDLELKTYSIYNNEKLKFITDAFSVIKNGEKSLSAKSYRTCSYRKSKINDGLGSGTKYIFKLESPGLPVMEQIFYTYSAHDFFIIEVNLKGEDLSSNYMAPLISEKVNLHAKGDNRTLFVPFDNDAFIRYNAKPMENKVNNTSSEVGVIYENISRKGIVAGSLEHMVWKTGVKTWEEGDSLSGLTIWGGYTDEKITRDRISHGSIGGSEVRSPKMFIGYFSDWRSGMEVYGMTNRIIERPYVFNWEKPTPFGWNSWGVIQEKINYDKALKVVDFFANEIPQFRNGKTAYIDLDSFWDNFTGGMSGNYTKLKEFADYCKSKGLEPGVYWAPFTDWGYKSGGNGLAEGSSFRFKELWTKVNGGYHDFDGARALDPTHPGTKKRIDYIIDKLKACGFTMIKIDFLGHAAAESDSFFDKSVTTGMQAYRVGMEYLIDRLDNKMLIYAAISPGMATGRYAHIRRIACDAWKTIKDTEYTINSVNYGWWQTYVYNYIDADHVVFGSEDIGANRARLASALITGTLITGDDFSQIGKWTNSAKALLQNQELFKIAKSGKAFMPVDGNTGEQSSELFVRKIDGYLYLTLFNFESKDKSFSIPLNRIGLKNGSYKAAELFDNNEFIIKDSLVLPVSAGNAKIIKIKLQ